MVIKEAVFFDRDGVLNRPFIRNKKPYAPLKFEDFYIYKDVESCVKKLVINNFLIFVITNQPDVGNGLIKKSELLKMHAKLNNLIKIEKIYTCTHSQDDLCECRKPNPFFLLEAKKSYNICFKRSYFVGDRYSDMLTSKQVNCNSIFIDRKYKETPHMDYVHFVKGIKEATKYILRGKND